MVSLDFEDLKRDGENTQKGLVLFVNHAHSGEFCQASTHTVFRCRSCIGRPTGGVIR